MMSQRTLRERFAGSVGVATGIFGDVPASDPFARWIERLAAEGFTGGYGGGNFCPGAW